VSSLVVTLGEAMLRLSPPDGGRLEQAASLDAHVAGSELNLAVALASLGVPARWLSALPDTPLGRRVASDARAAGVDTGHVEWVEGGRLGLFFVEFGVPPRPTSVLYDRGHSAFGRMAALDDGALDGARFAVVSGVTAALGDTGRALAERFAQLAGEAGAGLCIDVNHRSRLWSADEARAALTPLAERAEVVVCSRADAETVFGITHERPEDALRAFREGVAPHSGVVVVTLGGGGAVAAAGDADPLHQAAYPAAVRDRFGGGDAFMAGLLWGLVEDAPLDDALQRAAALAALKCTVAGDFARFTQAEVRAVICDPATVLLR
jgi:2-dehydro-3-deoxygluconokinase